MIFPNLKKLAAITILSTILIIQGLPISYAQEEYASFNPTTETPVETPVETPSTSTSKPKGSSSTSTSTESTAPDPTTIPPTKAPPPKPPPNDISTIFGSPEDQEAADCFPDFILKGAYFYTIVEEPIILDKPMSNEELQKLVNEGADFIDKPCTRNTLSYTYSYIDDSTGEKITVGPKSEAKLQNECNTKGQDAQKKYKYDPDNTVIFTCNQVQVFFSKGGTSLLEGYIKTIYTWAASIVGLIAVAVIVVSGIQISVSGGDSGALTSAKERIVRSLLGVAVLFLSGLILYTINPNFFVTTSTNKEFQTEQQAKSALDALTNSTNTGGSGGNNKTTP